jgi:DNA-binding PadR family transcriptional regulator
MRAWTDLSTSSIYYILGRLEDKGFIEKVKEKENEESERPRKVYQLTQEGGLIWKKATLEALTRPNITYTNFLMGLHNLWNIPSKEALEAVQSYRDWQENDLHRQRSELAELEELGLNRFPVDVLFEYSFVLGDAELQFLDDLIDRLSKLAAGSQTSSDNQKQGNEEEKHNG